MLEKVLVANRGEISIRAFRAAYELGIRTVAVYTSEDRFSLHRQKADEAYKIGEVGQPVRAYLDADALVKTALRVEADAIYPGYDFLSESAAFARGCEEAGLKFVGPSARVLELTGDKLHARRAAEEAGLSVLRASEAVENAGDAIAAAEEIGYPVFVKAAGGGGGRGLRLVDRSEDLPSAVWTAMREAEGAFGDATVFLEQALIRPRHIEVQILADGGRAGAEGEVVHLFERDCSVQRRHQKVLEVAPALNLDPKLRDRLCEDFGVQFPQHCQSAVVDRLAGAEEFSFQLLDNTDPSEQVMSAYLPLVYGKAKVAWQEHCPIGELLGPPPKEGAHLEYKSTLRTRADTGELFKLLQTASLKTVAAFLNSREGGTLLIGVADDGSVFGLDSDYATLRKPSKDDRYLFGLHLNQALINSVGMAAAANVGHEILEVGGKDLCRIHVRPSSFPVEANVVEVDKNGQHIKKNLFYGRVGNGTRPIMDPTERERYKAQVWGS